MLPLFQAIQAKCASTGSIVAAFPGYTDNTTATPINYPVGVYHGAAPPSVPLPYLVVTPIAAPTVLKYGGVQRVEAQVQFAAYGVGDVDTYTRLKVLTDVFDELILTLSTGHMVNTSRLGDPIPTFQDDIPGNRDESGGNVWQWTTLYEFDYTQT